MSEDNKKLMMDALLALKKSQAKVKQLTKELEEKSAANQLPSNQPIAIIGMACRMPADINDFASLTEKLNAGTDAIGRVPQQRWDVDYFYDVDNAPGKILSDQGGFVADHDKFDPQFFNISPREASFMDPQHRLLMLSTWEALENANIVPSELYQRPVGTFIGISTMDYSYVTEQNINQSDIDGYVMSGNIHSVAPGRISSYLGLTGPALAIDTACSSSLIAVHQACDSLRAQTSELAIAGGVNCIYNPLVSVAFSKAQMLAVDGRCKTFANSADGYVRGEGAGIVILKRLIDAERDNDTILAVINGSAINHNGPSGGLTVPSGQAQQQVISQALKNADIKPSEVDIIEAHGTGTSLGDPIELRALEQVFADGQRAKPLYVSSIKTNVGHLEAAAGIAGLMKMVGQLQQRKLYPHLHFDQPTSHFDWQKSWIEVPTHSINFAGNKNLIGGVSSFGINGSNVHLVLSQAPEKIAKTQVDIAKRIKILTLSAKTPQALQRLVLAYQRIIASCDEQQLADICYSSNVARSHFDCKVALAASNKAELLTQLSQLEHLAEENLEVEKIAAESQPTVWFSGEGCGRKIVSAVYEQAYQQASDVGFTQAWAQQYALGRWLMDIGLNVAQLIGVGQGELIVACLQHKLTLEQASKALKRVPLSDLLCGQSDDSNVIRFNDVEQGLVKLYQAGIKLDWRKVHGDQQFNTVALPTYPFEMEQYWLGGEGQLSEINIAWQSETASQADDLIAQFNADDHGLIFNVEGKSEQFRQLMAQLLLHYAQPYIVATDGQPKAIASVYQRWLKQSILLLQKSGLIEQDEKGQWQIVESELVPMTINWQDWQQQKQQFLANEELSHYIRLLDACFVQLPQILAGETKATDVLFPQGSMELMAGIYKQTAQSTLFNDIVHQGTVSYIKQLIEQQSLGSKKASKKIRIIEIGAGTGGTTAGLIPLLAPFAADIEHYCYTDLSPSFLRYGEQFNNQQTPFLTTELLNIEQLPINQGFESQSYDVVIATNVLHATKNMQTTMKHVKSLMRPGGLLLLNEISLPSFIFAHMSLALLEGWWLYEDEERRIEGSPGLYPQQWQQLLDEQGFIYTSFPAERVHDTGQQVVMSLSDGKLDKDLVAVASSISARGKFEPIEVTGSIGEQLQACLVNLVGEALQMAASKIDVNRALDDYGIDSIIISQLLGQLQQFFPRLDNAIFFEHRDIAAIANYLLEHDVQGVERMLDGIAVSSVERNADNTDHRAIIRIKAVAPHIKQVRARVVVFHPFGFGYRSIGWMKRLSDDVEVWAVGCEQQQNWQQLVAELADGIKDLFDVPVIAWGHSMGAVVGFETLFYLEQQYSLTAQQFVVSCSSVALFEQMKYNPPFADFEDLDRAEQVINSLREAHILPPVNVMATLSTDAVLNDVRLCKSYNRDVSKKLSTSIVAVQANDDRLMPDSTVMLDWQPLTTTAFYLEHIDGSHMFFTRPPQKFVELLLGSVEPD